METIQVWVNGQKTVTPKELNMIQFLEYLETDARLVAVEYNGEILHRQYWLHTLIQAGDRLEIVTIVGGG